MTTQEGELLRVLVVEDNQDHALFAERALRKFSPSATIEVAASPAEAIAAVDRDPDFDLLLVDYSLPEMNGLELARRLRERDADAPVMLMTALGNEEVAAAALRAGVSDYVSKGEEFWERLPMMAGRVLERSRMARRLQSLETLMLQVSTATNLVEMARRTAIGARLLLAGDGAAVWWTQGDPIVATDGPMGRSFRRTADRVDLGDDPSGSMPHQVIVRMLASEHDRRMGILAVSRPDGREMLPEEERVLNVFARFAGTAMENALLLAEERGRTHKLQEADRRKSEFISTVSHELLTPLTIVVGFGETLLQRWSNLDDEHRLEYVSRQLAHANDLNMLIHQVLDFSRLERIAPPAPRETRLLDILEGILIPGGEDRVKIDVPDEYVLAAPESLRSVLENLISNALKYSEPVDAVEVTAERDGGWLVISVADRGIGVPPDERKAIFQPFVRGRNVSSARGTGIGLAAVASHVKASGGEVSVEPREGGGSVFIVRLRALEPAV